MKFPVSMPDLSSLEKQYVSEAVDSTWISSSGKFLDAFENNFAQKTGSSASLAVSNGTVSLHLILLALGIGPGDEVIVPSFTYVASVNAITYVGATPVFCEVEEATWCLDSKHVESLISPKTVAIMAVHLYGHPADMDPLMALAKRHALAVIEDAAEAPFSTYKNKPVGSLGIAASFSFYGNKIITSGEGGAVTTSDLDLAQKMRLIRGQGMDPDRRYYFPIIGHNFRLTNVSAAILCAQLERLDSILENRSRVCQAYDGALSQSDKLKLQPKQAWATWMPWFQSVTLVDGSAKIRDALLVELGRQGIDTRPFFIPVHTLPSFSELKSSKEYDFPITNRLASSGFNLPTHSLLKNDDVSFISETLLQAIG